jgi:DNA-binding GntR family transcriptional regulator
MMASFARQDLSGYHRSNAAIHTLINGAAANPVLATTDRSIDARVQSLRFRTNQNEAKWKRAVKDHEQMLDAMDAPAMRSILVQHLLIKRDTAIDLMRRGDAYPTLAVA